jgi:hypothetical protein
MSSILTLSNGPGNAGTGVNMTDMLGLKDTVTEIQNNVLTVQGNISSAQGNITTLQGIMTTAQSNITALQGNMTTSQSNITALQGNMTTAQSNITALQNQISGLGSGGIGLYDVVPTISQMTSPTVPHFAKEWAQCVNSPTPNIIDIACSGDGRVALICVWSAGSTSITKDYGTTWSTVPGLSSNMWTAAMSLDGKYIVASDMFNYKISSDYGATFQFPASRPFQVQGLAISATGKHIAAACTSGQGLSTSSDYGVTWTQRETSTWSWNKIAMALDGSVMYACSDNGLIKKSTNNGSTWTTVYTDASSRSLKSICCSGDGKYILVCFSSSNQLLLSTDSGSIFNLVGTNASYFKVIMSSNGTYMAASVNGSAIYYSVDGGANWASNSSNQFCAIASNYNGTVIYNISPYNKVLINRESTSVINTTQPTVVVAGSHYFDPATNKFWVYNGTAWKSITLA